MAREAKRTLPAKDLPEGDPLSKELILKAETMLERTAHNMPLETQVWMLRSYRNQNDGATYSFLTGQLKKAAENKTLVAERIAILFKKEPDGKLSAVKTLIGFNDAPYDCFFLGSKKGGIPALPSQLFGYAGPGEYHDQHIKRCMDHVRAENDLGGYGTTDPDLFGDLQ